ncbi:MAG: hypothetical protein O2955_06725 [Planctomycetota bacterium]|nr:hypothetical protein [Planctomycetota bacterium]MDA1212189.1 hypothetical protein [Planctomycetota bacterium]
MRYAPAYGFVAFYASFVFLLGCASDEIPPVRAAETTVTVVFNDGHKEKMTLSVLGEESEERDDIQGIMAMDRRTRETVVISLEEARQQRPTTGQYVILQDTASNPDTN